MSVSIRGAVPGDEETIFALVRALAEYEKLDHVVTATAKGLSEALFAPAPRLFCDLAEWKGEPACGFSLWFYNYSSFKGAFGLYLEDLFVRPEQRGKGIGKALLLRLAEHAVERRCGFVQWAALDWNAPAIAFYESLGAECAPEWRLFRADPRAMLMAR